jgi:RNA polymerase sigma factor (sigma-70 family)
MDLSTPEGIAAFYSAHRSMLYRVAASVLAQVGAEREAEDVVLTVVEELLRKRPTGVTNAEAFVIHMIKRRAIDAIRSLHPKQDAGTPDALNDVPHPIDVYAAVDDAVDEGLAIAELWDAWDVLTDRERDVVARVILNNEPQKDVARALGVTPARISQLLSKALQKLRQQMEGAKR